MKNLKKYLTTDDIAEMFGVNVQTARKWARQGKIPAIKINDIWYFQPEDVEKAGEHIESDGFYRTDIPTYMRKLDPVMRRGQMVKMRENGATLDEIGKVWGITRQRVDQILKGSSN